MSIKSKKTLLKLIFSFAAFLLLTGSFIVFRSSAMISKSQHIVQVTQKAEPNNQKKAESETETKIEVNDLTKMTLRSMRPKLTSCKDALLFKQYSDKTYLYTDFTAEEEFNTYEGCTKNLEVYNKELKFTSDSNHIYLYEYVLLSDGNSYGKTYDNLNIDASKIVLNEDKTISEESFIGYAGLYKYTFNYINNYYTYYSTEKIKTDEIK